MLVRYAASIDVHRACNTSRFSTVQIWLVKVAPGQTITSDAQVNAPH
jgi:hypothetical protein